MILNLSRRWCGTFYLYRASLCHGNTDIIGEGGSAEEAVKNMAEGLRDDWAETTKGKEKPSAPDESSRREGR